MTDPDTTGTQIDGQEVVAREPATGVHPRTGDTMVYKKVERALLANGTEVYVCVLCGYIGQNARSVATHSSSHARTPDRQPPVGPGWYPPKVLRVLVREVHAAMLARGRNNYGRTAADALNARGIPALRGEEWTAPKVVSAYNRHKNRVRIPEPRNIGTRPLGSRSTNRPNDPDPTGVAFVPADVPLADDLPAPTKATLLGRLRRIEILSDSLGGEILNLRSMIQAMPEEGVDPELAAKARKWDQMQELMGNA